MKKLICLGMCLLLLPCVMVGCASENEFAADNEIMTYQKIDPERTQIVVSRTGNIAVEHFCVEFEARNPDIQVIYLDITGGNSDYKPMTDWLTKGYKPDIMFSGFNFVASDVAANHLENLSLNPIVNNYESAALKRTAVNNDIYSLPGPSNISAMMYNKTLFAEYGWEVPATFDAFVALCEQIRSDTNGTVEPWNPNAKYDMELLTVLEGFCYEEVFGGADNRAWYNDFTARKDTFADHMEPYYRVLQTLIDHDLLREEHFTYSATTRGKEFADGKIAMINMNIYDADNDLYDFGYMPFPTTRGDVGYLCDSYSCFVALPVKEHTDAEQDAIDRMLSFFSSAEGQTCFIGKSMMVSNVKDVPMNQTSDLASLQPAIDEGHMFAVMTFASEEGYSCNFSLHQDAMDLTAGTVTATDCIANVDKAPYILSDSKPAKEQEIVATAPDDMTMLETSFYMADTYRRAADADIGLIAHNHIYRGNMMRVFAGDITAPMVTVYKPRSFANGSTLVKVSMTGQQLLDALNHPYGDGGEQDCIYAYSGLKCVVAPWNEPGEKVLSVKLSDGSAIEPAKLYTVACWDGTVSDAYITEIVAAFEGTWEEMMLARLREDGTLKAAEDGRIKLVWDD